MRIIQSYVARSVLAASLIVLLGVVSLDLLFRIIAEAARTTDKYTIMNVLVYELLNSPAKLYQFMPMVGLIGCLTGLGALANNSELIVMRATGVSTIRLLMTALRPALILLVVAMLVGEYVAPKTGQMAEVYRAQAQGYNREVAKRGVWVRDGDDFMQINALHSSGILYGVTIFQMQGKQLERITQAQRAVFNQDHWMLEDVQQTIFYDIGQTSEEIAIEKHAHIRWHSDLKPDVLATFALDPDDLQIQRIWEMMNYYKGQALNSTAYELAFWGKVFYPLVMISLVIVGISFVFGPLREVSMGFRVFVGVLVGILLKTFQDTLGPISMVYGFSAMYAMLMPVLLCALIGGYLLSRVR